MQSIGRFSDVTSKHLSAVGCGDRRVLVPGDRFVLRGGGLGDATLPGDMAKQTQVPIDC